MGFTRRTDVAALLYRNLKVLAALIVLLVAALLFVAVREHRSEWRAIQDEYNRQARATGKAAAPVALRQIWRPELDLVDRCVSCHLGMGAAPAIVPAAEGGAGDAALFGKHPPVTHDVRAMGCTVCHRGQGAATTSVAAHGRVRFWDDPMLAAPQVGASCGFCHGDDVRISDGERSAARLPIDGSAWLDGKRAFTALGCRGCHRLGGIGGNVGPELDNAGAKSPAAMDFRLVTGAPTREAWHREHLLDPAKVSPGSQMPKFARPAAELDALVTYILSLRAEAVPVQLKPRPRLVGAESFLAEGRPLGAGLYGALCVQCHAENGTGKVIEALATVVPAIGNRDYLAVASTRYVSASIGAGRGGRAMPSWTRDAGGLETDEIDALVTYLESLRPEPATFAAVEALEPQATAAAGWVVLARDCAGCHGPEAAGTDLAPSLVAPELAAFASDRQLYEVIVRGVGDTAMPAFAHLPATSIASVLMALRAGPLGGSVVRGWDRARAVREVEASLGVAELAAYRAAGNAEKGAVKFKALCAGCHGPDGLGGTGPSLTSPGFLAAASDGFIAATILAGRSLRPMRPFGGAAGIAPLSRAEVADVIAYLRAARPEDPKAPMPRRVFGNGARGAEFYVKRCAECHGATGQGGVGPAFDSPDFQRVVADGFIQALIVRGNAGTPMRGWGRGGSAFAWLTPGEINDLVTHIRRYRAPEGAEPAP
ncbi:MAG: c-type cytochrome [Deltaproteobacteria bacterium]|nr:c-type cytochrome [Deltaproteobacteria bacterium]